MPTALSASRTSRSTTAAAAWRRRRSTVLHLSDTSNMLTVEGGRNDTVDVSNGWLFDDGDANFSYYVAARPRCASRLP
jgi:hypothetical protein